MYANFSTFDFKNKIYFFRKPRDVRETALEQGKCEIVDSLYKTILHVSVFFIVNLRIFSVVNVVELMASERHVKREIARLEEEIPQWKTIIDTGTQPGTYTVYIHVYTWLHSLWLNVHVCTCIR